MPWDFPLRFSVLFFPPSFFFNGILTFIFWRPKKKKKEEKKFDICLSKKYLFIKAPTLANCSSFATVWPIYMGHMWLEIFSY